MLVLPAMPGTEKKLNYYLLSSQVLLHPKIRILRTEIWLRPKLDRNFSNP